MAADKSKMKVMLAAKYEEKRVTYPCFVQPKLDGIRAYYRKGNLYSRDRKLIKAAPHIIEQLAALKLPDDVILDGELYKHGWPLNRINGACGVNRETPSTDSAEVGYCIFDLVAPIGSFKTRWGYITDFIIPKLVDLQRVTFVFPIQVHTPEQANDLYATYQIHGFEGMIYRIGDCLYRPGVRSLQLLKRKAWLDEWATVIGVKAGKFTELGSKFSDTLGSVSCKFDSGACFDVGSGFTDWEREQIWKKPEMLKRIHVRYEKLSDAGIPLKPTVIEWD